METAMEVTEENETMDECGDIERLALETVEFVLPRDEILVAVWALQSVESISHMVDTVLLLTRYGIILWSNSCCIGHVSMWLYTMNTTNCTRCTVPN